MNLDIFSQWVVSSEKLVDSFGNVFTETILEFPCMTCVVTEGKNNFLEVKWRNETLKYTNLSEEDIVKQILTDLVGFAPHMPKINHIYRHFKGGLYKIITCAINENTGEREVIYEDIFNNKVYVRSEKQFFEKIENVNNFAYFQFYRFKEVLKNINCISCNRYVDTEWVHEYCNLYNAKTIPNSVGCMFYNEK